DILVIGSRDSAPTQRLQTFLERNTRPTCYVDLDGEADVQTWLDRFRVRTSDIPILVYRGDRVLRNPSDVEVADLLGFSPKMVAGVVHDVVICGAGPAGLAAAVYGASEGLDVLVVEANAPGGQAGSSSRIENYLGFPTGLSGLELTGRAYAQAEKFGAQVLIAKGATKLACVRQPYRIGLGPGVSVAARTVVIATG